jgi:hypothetical protein
MDARERVKRFRAFIRKARVDTLQVLLPVPLPGTELTERLKAENRVYSTEHVGWEYFDGNFPLFEPDAPLTAEEMQKSIRKIMRRFYGMGHMFSVGLHILSFPTIVFHLRGLRAGWRQWYRRWYRSIMGMLGHRIIRKWTSQLRQGGFAERLARAKAALDGAGPREARGTAG